jgi:hypothetical protein
MGLSSDHGSTASVKPVSLRLIGAFGKSAHSPTSIGKVVPPTIWRAKRSVAPAVGLGLRDLPMSPVERAIAVAKGLVEASRVRVGRFADLLQPLDL